MLDFNLLAQYQPVPAKLRPIKLEVSRLAFLQATILNVKSTF
jgi:hypothetical protein